jgi:class 3 adenylate cyclase
MRVEARVLMMTDRVGSTAQTAELTHAEIRQVSEDHRWLAQEVMERWGGTQIKDTGDGYFVRFLAAYAAGCAALYLQELVRCRNAADPEGLQFELRIGLHAGDINVEPSGDVRGAPANVVARAEGAAPIGGVLVTKEFQDLCNPNEFSLGKGEEHELKGVGPVTMWPLTARQSPPEFENPFRYHAMWHWPREFLGRRREVEHILARIGGGMSVAVTGEKHIGKSWLLTYLCCRLRAAYGDTRGVVRADLHSARLHTRAGLLEHLSQGLGLPEGDTSATLAQFEQAVADAADQGPPGVVVIDEFERLVELQAEFGHELLESFRHLQESGRLVFVTASRVLPADLIKQAKIDSTFAGVLTGLPLGPFTQNEGRAFVSLPRPEVEFPEDEVRVIAAVAGTRPIRLQIACHHAAAAKAQGRSVEQGLREAEQESAFREMGR